MKRRLTSVLTTLFLLRYADYANEEHGGFGLVAARRHFLQATRSDLVHEASIRYGVHPALVRAVIATESNYDRWAISPKGALGLMQLMPETARMLGVSNPFDPRQNVLGGVRYLRALEDGFDGNTTLALAAYNAGPGAVIRYRGVPPYRETRAYLEKIRTLLERERR